MALTERIRDWQARGERVPALDGSEVFVLRQGSEGPAIVLLHGFPSSSYDWRSLLEQPEMRDRDVLAFDFLGFGLSDKPRGPYSLMTQADLVEHLVNLRTGGRVFIVAHDMGTSVASELFARQLDGRAEIAITGALLFNGSMLLHLAKPTIGQRLLLSRAGPLLSQLGSERVFRQQLGSVFSQAHPLSAEEAADQWSLYTHLDGNRRAHELIGYQRERITHAERWHGAIRDWDGSLSLLWGMKDPVARVDVLRGLQQLRATVPVTQFPELGHYPQIEDPAAVAGVIAASVR